MAVFHYLHLRAFAHATEDPERVKEAMRRAAQAPELAVGETPVEGSHGNRILILEAEVKNAPGHKALFRELARQDPDALARLVEEAPQRLDEHLNFFLRLDKQEAYQGRLALGTTDDAITVRGKVRSFKPRKGEEGQAEAVEQVRGFLRELARGDGTVARGGKSIQG